MSTFTLSIEPVDGATFQHPFHLGTIEDIARKLAEETFHGRNAYGKHTITVALMRDRKIIDVFDGQWVNSREWED
jgi:hypothetical protein